MAVWIPKLAIWIKLAIAPPGHGYETTVFKQHISAIWEQYFRQVRLNCAAFSHLLCAIHDGLTVKCHANTCIHTITQFCNELIIIVTLESIINLEHKLANNIEEFEKLLILINIIHHIDILLLTCLTSLILHNVWLTLLGHYYVIIKHSN